MRRAPFGLVLLACSTLVGCGWGEDRESRSGAGDVSCDFQEEGTASRDVELPSETTDVSGQIPVTISTGLGDLLVTLDADGAPCTVHSFLSLAEQGYFDDTRCHRLVTSGIFVLQCGDPDGTGFGGPGYTIPDEVPDEEEYPAGTIAMARTQQPHSGGSQFFIVYEDSNEGLADDYTVFGTLDEPGLQLVREVAAAGTAPDGIQPNTAVEIQSVTR